MTTGSESLPPARNGRSFYQGDRVLIAHELHPWHGRTAVIVAVFEGRSDWIVELDNGLRAAVTEQEIRHV